MSKLIKQMEMDELKRTFQDVRDMVILSTSRVSCQADTQLRSALRKKNIRLKVVKNSLARRVFGELDMKVEKCWEGPTTLAWGSNSLAELSKELDALIRKNDKIKVKGDVEQRLVELVCSDPPQGRCHWTLQLLADELVVLGLVNQVSTETVRQALKKTTSSRGSWSPGASHRTRTPSTSGAWRT